MKYALTDCLNKLSEESFLEKLAKLQNSLVLFEEYPNFKTKIYLLSESDKATLLIGRDKSCDICLPDTSVSRYHARIQTEPLTICDTNSSNGVLIDNKRINPGIHCPLKDGTIIALGRITLACFPKKDLIGRLNYEKQLYEQYQKSKLRS